MKIKITNLFLRHVSLLILLSLFFLFVPDISAQVKLAQTGFGFLSVSTDAKATAMGEAVTTDNAVSTAMFFNPAGISEMNSTVYAGVSQMKWIADIKYFSASLAYAPFQGRYGVFGVDFTKVDYGDFDFTRVAANEQGFENINDYPEPYSYSVKLVYGIRLSEEFSVGGKMKYAYQNLGNSEIPVYKQIIIDSLLIPDTTIVTKKYSLDVLAFDFGTIYKTGFKSLAFGMSVSNFSRELKYERESFQLPLTFKFGVSMNLFDFLPGLANSNSFVLAIDAVHPRSYSEYLSIGGEYTFMNMISLRAGYITKHEDYGLSFGLGVNKFGFRFDYSYLSHKVFNNVQRFSVGFAL
jgi:hypothetical protein